MWNNDVEISLVRPSESMDYFFRNGEGDEVYFVHEGSGHARTRPSATCRTATATTSSSRAGRRTSSSRQARSATSLFETPGLIEIPKRYRNEYGQLMEHAPFYHRDIHPPTELQTHRDRGELHAQGARPRRLPGLRHRLPPVRRRRLGRLRLSVDVLDPRLRADHRAHPHAAAVAPDVRRARTSSSARSARASSTSTRWRSRSRTTTRISRARR